MHNWYIWGQATLVPKYTNCARGLLATSYNNIVSIVLSSSLCYIISVFEISFLGMGLRPSTYSAPFL